MCDNEEPLLLRGSLTELKIPNFSLHLFVYLFNIMTSEPMHTALEERIEPGLLFMSECVLQLSISEIVKWPIHFIISYVQSVTQNYK